MTSIRILLILFALVVGSNREAGAIVATKWMTLGKDMQRGYVTATIDAWFNFQALMKRPNLTHAEKTFSDVVECINQRKFSYEQIYVAAIDYTKRPADRRQYNMAAVTWNTVSEMCKK